MRTRRRDARVWDNRAPRGDPIAACSRDAQRILEPADVTGSHYRSAGGTVLPRLAWLLAVAVFCWIAAFWIWRLFEPPPKAIVAPPITDHAGAIVAGSAFGYARPASTPPSVAPEAPPALDARLRLLGIAREPGDPKSHASRALFRIDRRILWLQPGQEIDRGIVLAAIDDDGVRIDVNGRAIRVALREPRPSPPRGTVPASAPVSAAPTAPAAAAAGEACKLSPEQRTRAYILRPEIIEGVMRERNGWTDLFKPAGIGLSVQNPGGTGAMLGLYGNDILTKAGGAQLGSLDDVVRLILEPLARNEAVVVSGLRSGQPREWIYAGINCLAR